MEVKEVFSYILLFMNFPCSRDWKLLLRNSPARVKFAPLPFLSDSDTHNVAVPLADKNPQKVGIVG
jgi:hypothetical protein